MRKGVPDKDGYLCVMFCLDGKPTLRKVHILVLDAFRGKRPVGTQTRHLDGVPWNNALRNVVWGTHAENAHDKIAHGTSQHGERNHRAKLTDEQAREVRESKGLLRVIAARFGIRESTVSRIRNGVRRARAT